MSIVESDWPPSWSLNASETGEGTKYGLQEQMGVTDFSRMVRPKSEQDLHH